jgi:phosphoribosylaminoimidazole-succinocarboxamide synthase
VTDTVVETALDRLPLFRRGKVRDTYDLGDELLMVATDRLSAFDVVLPTPIPRKGVVLTQLSRFWFELTNRIVPNHLVSASTANLPQWLDAMTSELADRAMIVRKAERIDVECVVRGYLAGSAWQEYRSNVTVAGESMPAGLDQSDRLPRPQFTPAVKNDAGHDANVSLAQLRNLIGRDLAHRLEGESLALYSFAADYSSRRGLILADTKFEFGWIDGQLTLIDELLTPDSSRFWDAAVYSPGGDPASFDKQYVRDWLLASGWNREPPGPTLPPDVVAGTSRRYLEAFQRLTGRPLPPEGGASV